MRFSSYAAGLIAVAGLMFQASAVHAQFTIIGYENGVEFGTVTQSITGSVSTQVPSNGTPVGLVGFSVLANNYLKQLQVTTTITGNPGAANTFSYTVTDNFGAGTVSINNTNGLNVTPTVTAFNATPSSNAGPLTLTFSETGATSASVRGGGSTYVQIAYITPVPEPTGVLMGLLGLPCLGAVVFFARRRSSAMAAMVA